MRAAELTSDFAAHLDEKRQKDLARAIQTLDSATDKGEIANPLFQDVKRTVNNCIDLAWRHAIRDQFFYHRQWEQLPADVRDAFDNFYPASHTITRNLRVALALPDHPATQAAVKLLRSIEPVTTMMANLKDKIVKGRANRNPMGNPRYRPPRVETAAIGRIRLVFDAVVEQNFRQLLDSLYGDIEDTIQTFMTAFQSGDPKARAWTKFYERDQFAQYICSRFLTSERYQTAGVWHSRWLLEPNFAANAAAEAQSMAVAVREAFVNKNLLKISAIVDTKGNLSNIDSLSVHVNMGGLTGRFRLIFADGSRFDIMNQAVWGHSKYGRAFMRYPLTFHNAVLANGERIKRASEKAMNDVFAIR